MSLWFDNTGLHCVGRVLERRADGRVDLDGFLQFASLLALTDQILINGLEPTIVAARSAEVCQILSTELLSDQIVMIASTSRDDYATACEQSADSAANQIEVTFDRSGQDPAATQPDMPRELLLLDQRMGTLSRDSIDLLEVEVLERRGHNPAALATLYMLAHSPDLQESVCRIVNGIPGWSRSHTSRLDTYLRAFLNDILARQHSCIYAPSVGRARTMRGAQQLVVELVGHQLTKLADGIAHFTTTLPALSRIILVGGRGEPEGMLNYCGELREKTTALRRWIARLAAVVATGGEYSRAATQVRQLAHEAANSLGAGPSILDAGAEIVWRALHGSPPLKPVELLRRFAPRATVFAFSELSTKAATATAGDAYYDHFERLCVRA